MVLPTKQILLSGIPSFFRFRTPLSSVTKSRSERRSEEHTSELQSRLHLVCRLLLEKKKKDRLRHSLHRVCVDLSGGPHTLFRIIDVCRLVTYVCISRGQDLIGIVRVVLVSVIWSAVRLTHSRAM